MKRLVLLLACLTAITSHAAPDTVISYQGSLRSNGQPANGLYDFVFEVYLTSSGGIAVAANTNLLVTVTDGLFNTLVDFGPVFDAQAYWLDISVRTNGETDFTPLKNRQRITVAPKAIHSVNADTAQTALAAGDSTINTAALEDGTILNVDIASNAAIADTKLATISSPGKVANSATTATISNTPNTIVARNEFGDIIASQFLGEGLDVTGFIRSGSETGTAQPPLLPGVVVRRFDSTNMTSGQVIAATDTCNLVRDGTEAGLRINYTASDEHLTFNAVGLSFYGTNVNFRGALVSNSQGFVQVFNNAQRVVHAEISFGNVYSDGEANVTQVILDRYDDGSLSDFYLSGTIISSYNQ